MPLENIINRTTYIIFLVFLVFASMLPSGTVLGIPLKHSIAALLGVLLIINILVYGIKKDVFLFYIAITAFLLLESLNSMLLGFEYKYILTELVYFFGAVLIFVTFDLLRQKQNNEELFRQIFVAVFIGNLIFLFFKNILFFLLYFEITTFNYIEKVIFSAINYTPVGLDIESGGSRFSFIGLDMLSLVLLCLLLFSDEAKKAIKSRILFFVFLGLCAISLYSAYSRLLFIGIFLMIPVIFALKSKKNALIQMATLCIFCILYFGEDMKIILEQRFANQEHSDNPRIEMMEALSSYTELSPVLGHGIGSFSPALIRDAELPFSYETQTLSFFMKFGIFFLIFICAVESLLIIKILESFKEGVFIFMVFNFILFGSMTNQYLLSSSVNAALLLLYAYHISSNKQSFKFFMKEK